MNAHRLGSYRLRSSGLKLVACSSLALFAVACGGDDPTIINAAGTGGTTGGGTAGSGGAQTANAGTGGTGGTSSAGTGGSGGTAGAGGSSVGAAEEHISGEITANTTWSAGTTYILDDLTYVVNNSTLTIEPGTTIQGAGIGSALIVTRGSRLVAEGTAAAPIVFTSGVDEGGRGPGDWGGVALLGAATVNVATPQLEGIEALGERGNYGGDDDAHDCGSLEYVRIEFAGFEFSADNELNGLTLAGCGTATNVDYVQVHRGSDDGIEVFGGKVDIKHAVLSNIQDDSLDWDFGWTGRAQFLVIRHDADASDAGFEADNGNPSTEVTPRSEPNIFNVTLVGGAGSTSPGVVLRRGTWGAIHNAIVTGFPVSGVDIRDAFSVDGTETTPPRLLVANSIFFENGAQGAEHADADGEAADNDDEGFDETAYLADEAFANRLSVDPELPDAANVTAPNLVPPATSPAATGGATPPEGFDVSATYVGALQPGGPDWTAEWTSFPED